MIEVFATSIYLLSLHKYHFIIIYLLSSVINHEVWALQGRNYSEGATAMNSLVPRLRSLGTRLRTDRSRQDRKFASKVHRLYSSRSEY